MRKKREFVGRIRSGIGTGKGPSAMPEDVVRRYENGENPARPGMFSGRPFFKVREQKAS